MAMTSQKNCMEEDTLRMLRDAVSAFTEGGSTRVRKARELENGFDRGGWKQIAEQGWISSLIPEDKGGLGLGCQAVSVIAHGLGKAAIAEPYLVSGVMPAMLLSLCQTGSEVDEKLAQIASGELLCALAWQSEIGSLDPTDTPLRATSDATGSVLTGAAHFLMTSGLDAVLVAALNDGVFELYWVPVSIRGIQIERKKRADWGYDSVVRFVDVHVTKDNLVGRGGDLENALKTTIDIGLVAASSELNGITEKMLELTLEYLKTRQQFDKPIGSFQSLKHRAVDLWMHLELSKGASNDASKAMDDLCLTAQVRSVKASGAKARASDVSLFVGKQAIQMHGAIGVTDEYDLSLYFNRALVLSAYLGNSSLHRARYVALKGGLK